MVSFDADEVVREREAMAAISIQMQADDYIVPPPVPEKIQVEAGFTAFFEGHAEGTQNYVCVPSASSPSGVAGPRRAPRPACSSISPAAGCAPATARSRASPAANDRPAVPGRNLDDRLLALPSRPLR